MKKRQELKVHHFPFTLRVLRFQMVFTPTHKPSIISMNNNFPGGFRNYDEYDEDFDDEFDEDFDDTFEEDFDEDFNNADFNRDDDDEDLDEATQLERFGQFLVDDEEEETEETTPYVRDEEDEADLLNPTGMKLDKKRGEKKTEKKSSKKAEKKSEKKVDDRILRSNSVVDLPEDDEMIEEDPADYEDNLIDNDRYEDEDY